MTGVSVTVRQLAASGGEVGRRSEHGGEGGGGGGGGDAARRLECRVVRPVVASLRREPATRGEVRRRGASETACAVYTARSLRYALRWRDVSRIAALHSTSLERNRKANHLSRLPATVARAVSAHSHHWKQYGS